MTDNKTELLKALVETYERHCARFEKVARKRQSDGEILQLEPVMRNAVGDVSRDGVLNLPTRCDFGISNDDIIQEKNLSTLHPDAHIQGYFDVGGLNKVWVSPFAWNALDVQFQLENEWPNFKPLRGWYLEWSIPPKRVEKSYTRGVLHRISGPTPSNSLWTVSLDLGTAPPQAVLDLLDILASIGTKNVSMGACVAVDAH